MEPTDKPFALETLGDATSIVAVVGQLGEAAWQQSPIGEAVCRLTTAMERQADHLHHAALARASDDCFGNGLQAAAFGARLGFVLGQTVATSAAPFEAWVAAALAQLGQDRDLAAGLREAAETTLGLARQLE